MTILGLAAALPGCQTSRDPDFVPARTPIETAIEGRPSWESPIALGDNGTIMVPFVVEADRRDVGAFDTFRDPPGSRSVSVGGGQSPFQGSTQVRWNNVAFVHLSSGERRLLLDRPGVISKWYDYPNRYQNDRGVWVQPPITAVVFLVTDEDTDGDKLLTVADARRVVLTDVRGRDARAITPAGTHATEVNYDSYTNTLFVQVIADTTGDARFDDADLTRPYAMRLGVDDVARPVVTDELIERAMGVLRPEIAP